MEGPLTTEELAQFDELGYVALRGAFPVEAAAEMEAFIWARLAENVGIDREDRSTWKPNAVWRLNKSGTNPVYDAIGGERMYAAFDQLLGAGTWDPPGKWGGFLVTFPKPEPEPWTVTPFGWHWDGNPSAQIGLKRPRSLFVFTLISDVRPKGGGTLLATGTHRLIDAFFESVPRERWNRQKPLKKQFSQTHPFFRDLNDLEDTSPDRIARFMDQETRIEDVPVRVVEATGQAGDAFICHPYIYHCRSMNCLDAPRFMRAGGPKPKG